MRKMASAIPILVMTGVFVILFVYMCMPDNLRDPQPMFSSSLHFLRTRLTYSAVLGGILMMAFYHLTLFIFRRRETMYLYFTIWCLLCVSVFVFTPNGVNDIFSWIPKGAMLSRFRYVTIFLYHNMISVVGLHVFSRRFLQARKKTLALYILLALAYICFVPESAPFYNFVFFAVVFMISVFVTVVAFCSRVLKENKWSRLFILSFVFFINVALLSIVVLPNVLYMPGLVAGLFLILAQSVMLSKNYTDAFKLVEETNENLERIVGDRTKDLQTQTTP